MPDSHETASHEIAPSVHLKVGITAELHSDPQWQLRYWLVYCGQALSLIGSSLTQFVLIWWITDTTGSVSALATAGLVALLPQALLGPLGGTFADRYNRRILMILADAVGAICTGVLIVLFLSEQAELWHVYMMMFVRSAMQAFQAPAAMASIAMLVPAHFLPRATGLNQTLQGMMIVASAPFGALAIGVMPIGWALSIDVVTACFGIVPLLIFVIPQGYAPESGQTGFWLEFKEGLYLVWDSPSLLRLYALLAGAVLVIMPSFTLAPLLVRNHFGGGPSQVAVMEGLSGVGMIVGGLIVAAVAPRRLIAWVLCGFAMACFTVAIAGLAPSNMFWLAVAAWVMSGMTYVLGNGPLLTLVQTTVPNHLQGRVLSLLSTITGLAAPIGLAFASPLGESIGIRWLFVLTGTLGGLVMLSGFLSPVLRQMNRQS